MTLDLLVDGESVKAKANLTVHEHDLALEAYRQGKTYIKVTALLHSGNQPRRLSDIVDFSIAEN